MKAIDEIKDEYSKEQHYDSFETLLSKQESIENIKWHYDNLCKRYAIEAVKKSLKNASENVKLGISEYRTREDGSIGWVVTESENLFIINDGCNVCATKESILSETNIPQEVKQ